MRMQELEYMVTRDGEVLNKVETMILGGNESCRLLLLFLLFSLGIAGSLWVLFNKSPENSPSEVSPSSSGTGSPNGDDNPWWRYVKYALIGVTTVAVTGLGIYGVYRWYSTPKDVTTTLVAGATVAEAVTSVTISSPSVPLPSVSNQVTVSTEMPSVATVAAAGAGTVGLYLIKRQGRIYNLKDYQMRETFEAFPRVLTPPTDENRFEQVLSAAEVVEAYDGYIPNVGMMYTATRACRYMITGMPEYAPALQGALKYFLDHDWPRLEHPYFLGETKLDYIGLYIRQSEHQLAWETILSECKNYTDVRKALTELFMHGVEDGAESVLLWHFLVAAAGIKGIVV